MSKYPEFAYFSDRDVLIEHLPPRVKIATSATRGSVRVHAHLLSTLIDAHVLVTVSVGACCDGKEYDLVAHP